MSVADPAPSWGIIGTFILGVITATVTVVGAIYALLRRLFVTRDELRDFLLEIETLHKNNMTEIERRYENKADELKEAQENMHRDNLALLREFFQDNVEGRHRLRDTLAAPVNKLNAEIIRLRESIDSIDRGDPR